MTFEKLRITGPGQSPYVLGAPMHLYDGDVHVGSLDPAPVNREGTEVHIGHFVASNIVAHQKRELGKLAMLEMVSFVVENFSTVQAVSFSLARDIEGYGDGMKLAGARSALLQSIGATDIMITPKPNSEHMGHFVVSGIWEYNQANLAALNEALAHERQAYGEREEIAARTRRDPPKDSWVRRILKRQVSPPPDAEKSRL